MDAVGFRLPVTLKFPANRTRSDADGSVEGFHGHIRINLD